MTCPAFGPILTGTLAGLGVVALLFPLIYAAGRTKGLTEPREDNKRCPMCERAPYYAVGFVSGCIFILALVAIQRGMT